MSLIRSLVRNCRESEVGCAESSASVPASSVLYSTNRPAGAVLSRITHSVPFPSAVQHHMNVQLAFLTRVAFRIPVQPLITFPADRPLARDAGGVLAVSEGLDLLVGPVVGDADLHGGEAGAGDHGGADVGGHDFHARTQATVAVNAINSMPRIPRVST